MEVGELASAGRLLISTSRGSQVGTNPPASIASGRPRPAVRQASPQPHVALQLRPLASPLPRAPPASSHTRACLPFFVGAAFFFCPSSARSAACRLTLPPARKQGQARWCTRVPG